MINDDVPWWVKMLCVIGLHTWRWKLKSGDTLNLNDPPPHARCEFCGARYKKEPQQ